jgi:hypothetical protein
MITISIPVSMHYSLIHEAQGHCINRFDMFQNHFIPSGSDFIIINVLHKKTIFSDFVSDVITSLLYR